MKRASSQPSPSGVLHHSWTAYFREGKSDKFYRVWLFHTRGTRDALIVKQWGRRGAPLGQLSYQWVHAPWGESIAREAVQEKLAKGYTGLVEVRHPGPAVVDVGDARNRFIESYTTDYVKGADMPAPEPEVPEVSLGEMLADIDRVLGRLSKEL